MNHKISVPDGSELSYKIWKPEGAPKGIIYLVHGLNESFEYYEEFAETTKEEAWVVFMHEARGHGRTAGNPLSKQYFSTAGDAGDQAIDTYREDLFFCINEAKIQYPKLPLSIVAHSLGTIVTLAFLEKYQGVADNVILIGTPTPKGKEEYERLLEIATRELNDFGGRTPSNRVYFELFSRVNEHFEGEGSLAFISRDQVLNAKALEYPFTKVVFNNLFFLNFIKAQQEVYQIENIEKIAKKLPILLLTGSEDYVTDYSQGLIELGKRLRQTSHHIDIKIYQGARHSLLREINRKEITADILKWGWENKTDMERC